VSVHCVDLRYLFEFGADICPQCVIVKYECGLLVNASEQLIIDLHSSLYTSLQCVPVIYCFSLYCFCINFHFNSALTLLECLSGVARTSTDDIGVFSASPYCEAECL